MWATSVLAGPLSPADRSLFSREAAIARAQARAHYNFADAESKVGWLAWVRQAFEKGASAAHAYVRRADAAAPVDTARSVVDEVSCSQHEWSQQWAALPSQPGDNLEFSRQLLRDGGWAMYSEVEPLIDAGAIPAAACRFRHGIASAFDALRRKYASWPFTEGKGLGRMLLSLSLSNATHTCVHIREVCEIFYLTTQDNEEPII